MNSQLILFNSIDITIGCHVFDQTISPSVRSNWYRNLENELELQTNHDKYSSIIRGTGPFLPPIQLFFNKEFSITGIIFFSSLVEGENITFNRNAIRKIKCYDNQGQLLLDKNIEDSISSIKTEDLPVGTYLICYIPLLKVKITDYKCSTSEDNNIEWEIHIEET